MNKLLQTAWYLVLYTVLLLCVVDVVAVSLRRYAGAYGEEAERGRGWRGAGQNRVVAPSQGRRGAVSQEKSVWHLHLLRCTTRDPSLYGSSPKPRAFREALHLSARRGGSRWGGNIARRMDRRLGKRRPARRQVLGEACNIGWGGTMHGGGAGGVMRKLCVGWGTGIVRRVPNHFVVF